MPIEQVSMHKAGSTPLKSSANVINVSAASRFEIESQHKKVQSVGRLI